MKGKHTIKNAYDAYWFLHSHPKFNIPLRVEISPEEFTEYKNGVKIVEYNNKKVKVSKDAGGKCYRYFLTKKYAVDVNLDIFYTKVNKKRSVDSNPDKNQYVECWLEFGPIQYSYAYSGTKKPMGEWDTETVLEHTHDIRLDTGAPTFDEALVKLAKLVKKYYGDFEEKGDD